MLEFDFTKPWHQAYFGDPDCKPGDIGLEIETELSTGFEWNGAPKFWRFDGDGSLRGNGYEFILRGPLNIDVIEKALDEWKTQLKGYKILRSPRTSVHVHFNMFKHTFPQILNFGLGYWLVEDWLMAFCGPSRKGNLFCLSNTHSDDSAAEIRQWLKDTGKSKFYRWTNKDQYKYTSFNFCTLPEIGSVEIRTMRGIDNTDVIQQWVEELWKLKEFMTQFDNPKTLLKEYVKTPKDDWIKAIFSPGFVGEVNKLHPEEHWKSGMDKAFFDLVQIAQAPKTWEYKLEKPVKKLPQIPPIQKRLRPPPIGLAAGQMAAPGQINEQGGIHADPWIDRQGRHRPAPLAEWVKHDEERGRWVFADGRVGELGRDPLLPPEGAVFDPPAAVIMDEIADVQEQPEVWNWDEMPDHG